MSDQKETKSICGTWKIEGLAAQLVLDTQKEMKNSKPEKRGYIGKKRVIQLLLCELYHLKNKKTAA